MAPSLATLLSAHMLTEQSAAASSLPTTGACLQEPAALIAWPPADPGLLQLIEQAQAAVQKPQGPHGTSAEAEVDPPEGDPAANAAPPGYSHVGAEAENQPSGGGPEASENPCGEEHEAQGGLSGCLQQLLSAVWGFPGFRGQQEDIITRCLHGHSLLAVLPTGDPSHPF